MFNYIVSVFEVLQMDVINILTSEIQNGKIIKLDKKNKDEQPRSKLCKIEKSLLYFEILSKEINK